MKEEIGLTLDVNKLQLYFSGRSEEERVFWDDYYIKMDIADIKKLELQKDEVESVEWLSEHEILDLMEQDKFFKNHFDEFKILIEWLNKN